MPPAGQRKSAADQGDGSQRPPLRPVLDQRHDGNDRDQLPGDELADVHPEQGEPA
jgi:hypothetical protein